MTKVVCHYTDRDREVEAIRVERGLAITPYQEYDDSLDGEFFAITHVASGCKLNGPPWSFSEAQAWFDELLGLDIDWSLSVDELQPYGEPVAALRKDFERRLMLAI